MYPFSHQIKLFPFKFIIKDICMYYSVGFIWCDIYMSLSVKKKKERMPSFTIWQEFKEKSIGLGCVDIIKGVSME